MSIKLLSAAWDLPIPSTEKMVLMCLCDYSNDDGVCWPSIDTLCRKTSKSERTVQSALKWLASNGYFTFRDGEHKARTYYLDPRKICAQQNLHPAETAPRKSRTPQVLTDTPAESAPHPRKSRTQTPNEPPGTTNTSSARGARATRLAEDWEPGRLSGRAQAMVAAWPPGMIEREMAKFRNHWLAKGGREACKTDWQRTWVNWLISSDERIAKHGNTGRNGGGGRTAELDGFGKALREMSGFGQSPAGAADGRGGAAHGGMGAAAADPFAAGQF